MPRLLKTSDTRKQARYRTADSATEALIARILADDSAYKVKVALVRRLQKRLRGRLSSPSWQLYLRLEEAEVGRWTHAIDEVAKWALAQRRKSRRG